MSRKFHPISSLNKENVSRRGISRKRNPFNDTRLYNVFKVLTERMEETKSICVQQNAHSTAESAQFYRFYGNEKVSIPELIKMNCEIKADLSATEVICISDSTSFNLSKRKGRIKDFDQLGVLQDNKTKGFHAHASIALDAKDGSIIGLTDVIYWHRRGPNYKESKLSKTDKESHKWYLGASNSNRVLSNAKRLSFLFDREADDFSLFEHIQIELQRDFIIRAQHNREVIYQDKLIKLKQCLSECPVRTTYEVDLIALDHYSWTHGKRIKRVARKATLQVRYVKLKVPPAWRVKSKEVLELTAIQVKEVTENLPQGEAPLEWILWTTHNINEPQEAIQCVSFYLLRWTIEQLFRTLKKKGFQQESTELETIDAIVKQTTMAFNAATSVMQLVHARTAENTSPIEYVFDEQQQEVLQKVNERMEGKTEKQKNPFPSNQLNWAAWIIARLGGWKGYQSQKPPGPITMKRGLDKFQNIFQGYQLYRSP